MLPIFMHFFKQLLILLEIAKELVWLLYCIFCFVFMIYLVDKQFPDFKESIKSFLKYIKLI